MKYFLCTIIEYYIDQLFFLVKTSVWCILCKSLCSSLLQTKSWLQRNFKKSDWLLNELESSFNMMTNLKPKSSFFFTKIILCAMSSVLLFFLFFRWSLERSIQWSKEKNEMFWWEFEVESTICIKKNVLP